MKWANSLRRWTMHSIHSMILGAALLGSAGLAIGQTPPLKASAGNLPARVYARNLEFDLPLNSISESWRAKVSEFRLYTKTPTTEWKLYNSGPQSLQKFDCKVPQDGEYWYTLVTMDLGKKATPADVNAEPPGQRVVVDTTNPVITVQGTLNDGVLCLRCTMQDANPDLASLRAAYKTDDGDVPLEPAPNQPGVFKLKGPEMMQYPVVVAGKDLAKNEGVKEVNVRELVSAILTHAPKSEPLVPSVPSTVKDVPAPRVEGMPLPPSRMEETPLIANSDLPPKVEPQTKFEPATRSEMPDRVIPFTAHKTESPVAPALPNRVELPNPPPLNLAAHASTGSEPNINVPANPLTTTPAQVPVSTIDSASRGNIPYQLINTTHASVDYRIDRVGPSGVGKVEIYMTPDKGQTWHRLGEDPNKSKRADVNLPGDGVFGVRIVITNGNGFGGRTPIRGETAHCEIEVDSTSPFVQLRSAELIPSTGHVELRWNAQDRNFGKTPINLFYRTSIDSKWQKVAQQGLKNDGIYRWAFPRDSNSQFFFKIEATDQAGNVAHDVTRQPLVIDVSEPGVTVVGVSGSTAVRPVPGGQ